MISVGVNKLFSATTFDVAGTGSETIFVLPSGTNEFEIGGTVDNMANAEIVINFVAGFALQGTGAFVFVDGSDRFERQNMQVGKTGASVYLSSTGATSHTVFVSFGQSQ